MTAHSILLVEDESALALTFEDVLTDSGLDVRLAFDGSAALAALNDAANHFDMVVTDIALPGADGWSVARRARQANPQLPVLYISGHKSAEHATEGAANSRLLPKPFAPEILVSAVHQALRADTIEPRGLTDPTKVLAQLERTERHVLQLLTRGAANVDLERECKISAEGVRETRRAILEKLGFSRTADAIRIALTAGLS